RRTRRSSGRSSFCPRARSAGELAPAAAQPCELRLELCGKFRERRLAPAHECELALDVRDRGLDDAEPLLVTRVLLPAAAQRGTRLLRLGELDELLEREPE